MHPHEFATNSGEVFLSLQEQVPLEVSCPLCPQASKKFQFREKYNDPLPRTATSRFKELLNEISKQYNLQPATYLR